MRLEIDPLEQAVALNSRDKLYTTISANPGLHFRELQRRTGLATGALQYHVDYLKKKHLVNEQKEGKFSRFYAVRGPEIDTQLMNLLRQDSVRAVILFLMKRRRATLPQISREINLSLSTTSFHLQKLVDSQLVVQKKYGGKTYFILLSKDKILEMILSYKTSFLDSVVDSFAELWEEELVK